MVAQPDPVADVLAPVVQQVVRLEVVDHRLVDVGAGDAGAERVEGRLLGGDRVIEEPSHLVGRGADDHRALELGVVAPDRRAVSVTRTWPASNGMLWATAWAQALRWPTWPR